MKNAIQTSAAVTHPKHVMLTSNNVIDFYFHFSVLPALIRYTADIRTGGCAQVNRFSMGKDHTQPSEVLKSQGRNCCSRKHFSDVAGGYHIERDATDQQHVSAYPKICSFRLIKSDFLTDL